jgi:hypothetical protein
VAAVSKKIGGRVNMYIHGWLLLTDGEGIGVGCPCLAPPERERGITIKGGCHCGGRHNCTSRSGASGRRLFGFRAR